MADESEPTQHYLSAPAPRPTLPPRSAGLLVAGLLALIAGQVLALSSTDSAVGIVPSLLGLTLLVLGIGRLAANVDGLARRAALRDFEAEGRIKPDRPPRHA